MKLYAFMAALSIFFSWFTVHAEELTTQPSSADSVMTYKSSAQNRQNKTWTAEWQMFGVGPNGTSEGAVIIGHHIDANSLWQIEVGSGGTSGSTLWLIDHLEYSGTAIGVHYKRFIGNSFYVKMGIDYRSVKYDYTYPFSGYEEHFEGNSIAAGLVIGNQWQWDNFTLGCDWVGVSLPFASSVTNETVASSSDSYYRSSLDDAEAKYLRNGFAQALRFYVGYSF